MPSVTNKQNEIPFFLHIAWTKMEKISKTSVSMKKQALPMGPEAVILESTIGDIYF